SRQGQVGDGMGIPCLGALPTDQFDSGSGQLGVEQWLAAGFAVEHRYGHAPNTLARYAPVRTGGNHVGEALLAPGGRPANLFDFFERPFPKPIVVDVDKPLVAGAEDDRPMAAPAMRVGMFKRSRRTRQGPPRSQQFDDRLVGFEDLAAAVGVQAFRK